MIIACNHMKDRRIFNNVCQISFSHFSSLFSFKQVSPVSQLFDLTEISSGNKSLPGITRLKLTWQKN